MQTNFAAALDRIRASEGGLRVAASERGGASYCGVTLGSYGDYCKAHNLPAPTLEEWLAIPAGTPQLTDVQVAAFYVWAVFDPIRFNELPSGVDYAVVDGCVNSGDAGFLGDLRWLFGTLKPSAYWRMDDALLAALKALPSALVIDAICNMRWAKMEAHSDFLTPSVKPGHILGEGRAFRMSSVYRGALEMAGFPPEPDKYAAPALTLPKQT